LQLGQALLFFRILGRKVIHIFPKIRLLDCNLPIFPIS
jgi:hypothetical protein